MKNALGSKGIFMFLLLAYSSSGNSDVVYKGEAIFGTAKQYAAENMFCYLLMAIAVHTA